MTFKTRAVHIAEELDRLWLLADSDMRAAMTKEQIKPVADIIACGIVKAVLADRKKRS